MSRDPPLLEGHVDTAGSLAMQTAADAPHTRPPSEPSEGSGSGSDEPVRLPADVLANLRRFLLPLGTRRRWPLRLFATSFTVVGMVAGYLGMQNIKRALANETPAYARLWSFMEAETLINQALVGMVATECTMVLSQAVLLATAPPGRRDDAAVGSSFYLNKLLQSEVSRDVCTRIDVRTRLCIAEATLLVAALISLPLRTAATAFTAGADLGIAMWVCYITMMIVWLPVWAALVGWLLFFQVPVIVVGDHIARIASGVHNLSTHSRPINFDALTRSVCHAHDLQRHLSALLAPMMKTFVLLAVLMVEHFTLLAIVPRAGIGLEVLPQRWHFAMAALLIAVAGGWPLRTAAGTTSECIRLSAAISALRVRNQDMGRDRDGDDSLSIPMQSMDSMLSSRQPLTLRSRPTAQPLDAATAEKGPHLATVEQLAQIDALLAFVRGLNGGQGIGFVFLQTTITAVSRARICVHP